jgi:hypothetical protein
MAYRLFVDFDIHDYLSEMSAAQRRRFYGHFRHIQEFPTNSSNYVEYDVEGREVNVSIFEGFRILYWIDHADCDVKILEIAPK